MQENGDFLEKRFSIGVDSLRCVTCKFFPNRHTTVIDAIMVTETSDSRFDTEPVPLSSADLATIGETSRPFVGRWHTVVSQTNWEKGRIITEWRNRLADAGVAARLVSDPAWCRLVGEVSPQHAGRLRRAWERFGTVHDGYEGLYWSHFLAALDWHDAEMWLEGAVQNDWSVSKMRFQRWEATGAIAEQRPDPFAIVSTPDDEGVQVPSRLDFRDEPLRRQERQVTEGPLAEGPDFGDEDRCASVDSESTAVGGEAGLSGNRVNIDEILAKLPADVAGPFRKLREAISRYRDEQWTRVERMHVVALLNDLREVVRRAPVEG